MASSSSSPAALSSTIIDSKISRSSAAPSPQCVTLPSLPPRPPVPTQSQKSQWKTSAYCRKIARNVMAMATGEAPAQVGPTELPEIVKTIQEAWEKVEDKYAMSSLAVAGVVALWGSTGLISAIDRLPVVPGVLEAVGIGYTGWFVYKNIFFKPDRDAFVEKLKATYSEITGSSWTTMTSHRDELPRSNEQLSSFERKSFFS